MKRLLIALAVVIGAAVPSFAQLTPAPFVLQQYLNDNGQPYGVSGMCIYRAGTSTLATTYTTAGGGVANANPLMMSSGGRPSSNGFFLVPGSSYKLVFTDFTNALGTPTCTPSNGVTVWTQDDIRAVPTSSGAVDISGTAGESIAAGQAVYLSAGAGGTNAGQWYLTDSDNVDKSVAAFLIGIAPTAIVSGAQGSIRLAGEVTLTSLSPGTNYYAGATAGALTGTAPSNARYFGQAMTATLFLLDPAQTTYVKLITTSTAVDSLKIGGGMVSGTGAVQIMDATGKIPILNSLTVTSTTGIGITSIPVLLKSGSGSTTSAAASNVDTILITGLTALDKIRIVYTLQAVTQPTTTITAYNATDGVAIGDLNSQAGLGALAAGENILAEVTISPSENVTTALYSSVLGFKTSNASIGNGAPHTVTTAWTGAWTLALRQGGVTAGGTFRWSWQVWKLAAQ